MGDFPLPHVLQPVVQLFFGRSLPSIIVGWWFALLQADVVVGVLVAYLTHPHASVSANSLKYAALAHERFG